MKTNIIYILVFIILVTTLSINAQSITNKQCISGNCQDGFGTLKYKKDYKSYRYKGEFKNGMFNGSGVIYHDDPWGDNGDIPQEVGIYKDNERRGGFRSYFLSYDKTLDIKQSFRKDEEYIKQSDKTIASKYKVIRIGKSGKVVSTKTTYFVHYSSDGKKIILDKPFAKAFGRCISGNCDNGEGKLQLDGIGTYEGKFINSRAHGIRQKLTLTTGEMMFVTIGQGIIYKDPITVKLPTGVSRVEMAKRRVWKLRPYSCLEGDCYTGRGTALYGNADRAEEAKLERYLEETQGYFVGEFKNNIRQEGTLYTFKGRIFKGNFAQGLNGKYTATINGKAETWHFKYGKRVTADGQPYEKYLAQKAEKSRKSVTQKYTSRNTSRRTVSYNTNIEIPKGVKLLHHENIRDRSFYFPAFLEEKEVYIQIIDLSEWIKQEVSITHGSTTKKYIMKDGKISIRFRYNGDNKEMGFGSQRNSKYKVLVYSTRKATTIARKENRPKGLSKTQHKGIVENMAKDLIPQLNTKYGYSHIKTEYVLASNLPKTQILKMHGGNEYGIIAIVSDSKITPKLTWKYTKKGSEILGTKDEIKVIAEGVTRDNGLTELNPDLKKIKAWRNYILDIKKQGSGSSNAYIVLIYTYKSKDNTSSNHIQNKAEDYYSKIDEAKMDNMAKELLKEMNKNKAKTNEILKKKNR